MDRGFQRTLYTSDVLIRERLSYALIEFLNNILVISDDKQPIGLMNKDNVIRDFYCHVLNDCRERLEMFQASRFMFVRREHNRVAGELAKDCRKTVDRMNETHDVPYPPNFFETLVNLNCMRLFETKIKFILMLFTFFTNKKEVT